MKTSELNEWLQVVASGGVIIGLLFVAYEVRQGNLYAAAEADRSNFTGWEEISISEYETDIGHLYVKSVEDPQGLTTAEMFKLSAWLTGVMNQYERALRMSDLGLSADQSSDLTRWSNAWFGNRFGRAWLEENKTWIDPRNIAAIERGLESTAKDAGAGYYER
jgi:hypothetical protein